MANGLGPRKPEAIHVLPKEISSLPVEAQISHMAQMLESYLERLFTHTYNIEWLLKDGERAVIPRLQSIEEYQGALRKQDAIGQVSWVKERRGFEGKILAAVVAGILINAIGLVIVAIATFRSIG